AAGIAQRLAVLQHHQPRDRLGPLDHQGPGPAEALRPLARRRGCPAGQRRVRRRDRGDGVLGRAVGDLDQGVLGRRVGDAERAGAAGPPLAADAQPGRLLDAGEGGQLGSAVSRHASSSVLRTVSVIRSTEGTTWSSRASAAGSGMCGVVILTTGPRSEPNASSATIDAISAPQPHNRGFSSTVNSLPVFATSARMVRVSRGTSLRTSTTLQAIPCSSESRLAAASARGTIAASATIVASLPSVSTFALPSGSTISASATSPLAAYSDFCSKNSTGSGSLMAEASSPTTSWGLEGATTFRPGTAIAQFSTDCECCAPNRTPAP